jgi:hypothetical protein
MSHLFASPKGIVLMSYLDSKTKIARFASGSLALGGLILMAMGAYFAFLRPSLLPEDIKYMSSSVGQIQSALPGLLPWLARVFSVLGGFMFATGLLTVYVAVTSLRARTIQLTTIVAISGLGSIGWMAFTNFLIDSDFKWLLLAFTFPWFVAVVLYSVSKQRLS